MSNARQSVRTRRTFLSLPLMAVTGFADASDPLAFGGVILLQPQDAFAARAGSPAALSDYIKSLVSAANTHFATAETRIGRSGYVVVAVRPIRQSKVWFDFAPLLETASQLALSTALQRVIPMPVREGPVVFALKFGAFGQAPPSGAKPLPPEWLAEVQRSSQPMHVEQIVLQLWP